MMKLFFLLIWFAICAEQDARCKQISNGLTLGAAALAIIYLALTGMTWLGSPALEALLALTLAFGADIARLCTRQVGRRRRQTDDGIGAGLEQCLSAVYVYWRGRCHGDLAYCGKEHLAPFTATGCTTLSVYEPRSVRQTSFFTFFVRRLTPEHSTAPLVEERWGKL